MIDLKLDHVTKVYRIQHGDSGEGPVSPLLRKINSLRRPRHEFYAVRDVSFEVERGEALGIIGHNGAGKSTILKLLSNITTPTSGEIMVNGRLAALIEVGSGFHPELTGRENIYLNGSILGMRRREITAKLDSIIDFAGVREFIDTPVKRFSSGMYVRLGFSIAAYLEPDILLLDEVLAVGDAAFQAQCLQRIGKLKKAGTTIVFISHDLGAVERLCDRVLLLKRGELAAGGAPADIVTAYQNDATLSSESVEMNKKGESKEIEIRTLSFRDPEGRVCPAFRTAEALVALVEFEAHEPVADVIFSIIFFTADGRMHCELTTEATTERLSIARGRGTIEFRTDELGLLPGIYFTSVFVKERNAADLIHCQYKSTVLRVDAGKEVHGSFYLPQQWRLRQTETASEDDDYVPLLRN